MARHLIRSFDNLLCRTYGVFEYCDDPACILRLQAAEAKRTVHIPDLEIQKGAQVLLLHLWNEQLLQISPSGPDLTWAKAMQRAFIHSLQGAAGYLSRDQNLAGVQAVGGVTILFSRQFEGGRLMKRLGFTLIPYHSSLGRFGEFWDNLYSGLLIWAYNPNSLPYHRLLSLSRTEFWIAKEEFLRKFGQLRQKSGARCPGIELKN
jgi:hypothetical protein